MDLIKALDDLQAASKAVIDILNNSKELPKEVQKALAEAEDANPYNNEMDIVLYDVMRWTLVAKIKAKVFLNTDLGK